MKYRIIWDKKPARQIKKFDPQIRRIVKEKVDKLIENPHQYAFLSGPLSSLRKIDISTPSGQYRVAFSIDEKEDLFFELNPAWGKALQKMEKEAMERIRCSLDYLMLKSYRELKVWEKVIRLNRR